MFSASQKVIAKHLYSLLSSLPKESREGATLALSTITTASEDGFLSINGIEPRTDFFVQCFDVMVGASLSLKMLRDDGLISDTVEAVKMRGEAQSDADIAINRIETMMGQIARVTAEEVN